MHLAARILLLALALMAEAVAAPRKGNRSGEPEAPASREPPNPDEEESVGFGGPWVEDDVGLHRGGGRPLRRPGGEEARPVVLGTTPRFPPWPQRVPGEPVCRVNLGKGDPPSPRLLEVTVLLRSYDSGFLEAVSRTPWGLGDLETFGACPTDPAPGLLASLRRVAGALDGPGEHRVLISHLEEVKWEGKTTKLRFKLAFHDEEEESLGFSHLALLVFYRGEEIQGTTEPRKKFLVGGDGLPQTQALCISSRTRYLVFQASETPGEATLGKINMDFALQIKPLSSHGAALSPRDAQELLFGFDAKCFTRMTPAVVLVAPRKPPDVALPASSFLAADGRVDTVPYLKPSDFPMLVEAEGPSSLEVLPSWMNLSVPIPTSTGRFLETLSQFVNKVLNPSGEPSSASRPHLKLDLGTMEALPHLWLNLSEKVALEELVRSDDHLVVLFPEDSQAWVEHQVAHWYLEGTLLQQLLEKLHAVIQDLEALPAFRANVGQFRALLASCYYPPGSPEEAPNSPGDPPSVGAQRGAQGSPSREKFHSLLLLKALQAVRAHWRESRQAASRAHRRARHQDDYCQLRELTIDLFAVGHILLPESYDANNCVGSCRSPLSTRIHDSYSHTILLLRMHEQGLPVMRPPCCVPVKYSKKKMLSFIPGGGVTFKVYPNMVAEACGCR